MPYFEREPNMGSIIREQSWRLNAIERNVQEAATQTAVLVPDYAAGNTRALNDVSLGTSKTKNLVSMDVTTSDSGFIEMYARVSADALVSGGTGRSMVMRIKVDGVSQGSYLSWTDQALTEKRTIQGSTIGTSATSAGGFIVVDDLLPNVGWDETASAEVDTIYMNLVANEGVHTVDVDMVCTGSGTFGSVYKAVISLRTT